MKRPTLSGWVWVAIGLTVAYAVTAWYILSSSLPTMTSCSEGELVLFRACLTLNEVGDLAAGLFAPVAFIWLAVAVLVQAQELNAQRDELKLTRDELHEQRQVMKEQAEEAKRQAEFIGRQTEILAREQSERDEKRADELVFEHIGSLRDWLNREYILLAPSIDRQSIRTDPPSPGQTKDKPAFKKHRSTTFSYDNQSAMRGVRQLVYGLVSGSDGFHWLHTGNYAVLRQFHQRCAAILERRETCSPTLHLMFDDAQFELVVEDLNTLCELCKDRHDVEVYEELWDLTIEQASNLKLPDIVDPLDFALIREWHAEYLRNQEDIGAWG